MLGASLRLLNVETGDLNTAKAHVLFDRRALLQEVILHIGNTLSREALLSWQIGDPKADRFELSTQFVVPVSKNTFILRASNGVECNYGKMNL